jgi:hypothetical protein
MSGHNKWSTIKQKKGKNDAARAKVFTKIGRELIVAIKTGGSADPNVNSKLRDTIAKAKAANVPNDNIERIIKKAANDNDATNYEAVTYEHGTHFVLPEGMLRTALPFGLKFVMRFLFRAAEEYPDECEQTRRDIDRRLSIAIKEWKRSQAG